MVLGQLAAGRTRDELLEDYPYLEPEDVTAAVEYGAARVNEREVAGAPAPGEAADRRKPVAAVVVALRSIEHEAVHVGDLTASDKARLDWRTSMITW